MIKAYLDRPEVRSILGVETPYNFSACSNNVGKNFNAHMDKWVVHTQDYIANLLDRGVRILIYAGTYDWQCNYVANKLWVDKLQWSGSGAYAKAEWRDWTYNGKKAGEVKETELLTFATIRGAGHMMSIFYLYKLKFFDADNKLGSSLFFFFFLSLFVRRLYVPHDKPAESLAMVSSWLAQERL